MHVMDNPQMFSKILLERDRLESIADEQQERDEKMQKWLEDKIRKAAKAKKE